ncbi:MAG: DsbA family protein [Candidatus Diapherotrites archaeon]|uniref:DsbA family protein n=1 Tax=Candidatus Iainarchaeum sp. TaxID=3101447 RepID=A0A8T3YKT7_9ARCH|nr:DsbA family protein [Candidatus Diapherotrites archaeon]
MSRLKEMKAAGNDGESSGLLYTVIGVALVIAVLAAFYLFLFSPQPKFGLDALEKGGHSEGNPDSKVRIVEFSDFECPACGDAYDQLKTFLPQYLDRVKFTYMHFPISNLHPFAKKAAESSECAAEQGDHFWAMHDKLFDNRRNLAVSDLKGYAKDLGLDTNAFNSCLESGRYATAVASSFSLGRGFGVSGTPTFFINGEKANFDSYAQLRQIIDQKLASG